MENEVSKTVEIAVMMVGLSAMITIILAIMPLGKAIQEMGTTTTANVTSDMSDGYIKQLAGDDDLQNIPSATAYSIILSNKATISKEVSGYDDKVRNMFDEDSILKTNLKGRVKLDFVPDNDGASYIAVINILNSKGEIENITEEGLNKIKP